MKLKIKTVSKLKEELDKVFSIYIRTRDIDEYGLATCFTCGKRDKWAKLQCGHYWSRAILPLRHDEINCQVQCFTCNIMKEGNKPAFTLALQRKYGAGILDKLELRVRNQMKMDKFTYEYLIQQYKEKLRAIVNK